MESGQLLVDLPLELAGEAASLGFGEPRFRRRGGIGDAATLIIGLGGSAISLMQAPSTIPEFVRWLVMATQRDDKLLEVRHGRSGEVIITIGRSVDPKVAIEALEKLLKGQ